MTEFKSIQNELINFKSLEKILKKPNSSFKNYEEFQWTIALACKHQNHIKGVLDQELAWSLVEDFIINSNSLFKSEKSQNKLQENDNLTKEISIRIIIYSYLGSLTHNRILLSQKSNS